MARKNQTFHLIKEFQTAAAEKAAKILTAGNRKNSGRLAVLVIDAQREFCDPRHRRKRGNGETVRTSKRIARIVPRFRSAGIPVYAIYFDKSLKKKEDQIDWYKFRPAETDTLIPKNKDSAIRGSHLRKMLNRNGHRILLVCGFNRSACVGDTIVHASRAGYKVVLMTDLTANDRRNPKGADGVLDDFDRFVQNDIGMARSTAVLKMIPWQKAAI